MITLNMRKLDGLTNQSDFKQETAIEGKIVRRADVENFLDSGKPVRYSAPARNYYLLRRTGESVGAKALIYTLLRGFGHHGHSALWGLLELGFPVAGAGSHRIWVARVGSG